MRRAGSIVLVLCVLANFVARPSGQASATADEKAIREQIARYDRGERDGMSIADVVFWSAAYRRPTIGRERSEESTTIRTPIAARVPNSQRNKTTPVRIVVAKSGDLAYEFSNGELSYETKDGRAVVIPQGILRTWQKDGGRWKVAAMFTRPLE